MPTSGWANPSRQQLWAWHCIAWRGMVAWCSVPYCLQGQPRRFFKKGMQASHLSERSSSTNGISRLLLARSSTTSRLRRRSTGRRTRPVSPNYAQHPSEASIAEVGILRKFSLLLCVKNFDNTEIFLVEYGEKRRLLLMKTLNAE